MDILRRFILDLIFPRRCLGCKVLLEQEAASYVCRRCLATIAFKNNFACAFCGAPVAAGRTCPFCAKGHFLDRLLVVTSYENPLVKKIVKTMKYRFVGMLARDIAGLMAKYLKKWLAAINLESPAIIVPVPLHRRRLNWRGFNQAELIGKKIAENCGLDVGADALRRVRANKSQAEMADRDQRVKNSQNIFRHTGKVSVVGKTILLIDDISTTGYTLNDCARALKGAGAKEVIGFVFARNKLKVAFPTKPC